MSLAQLAGMAAAGFGAGLAGSMAGLASLVSYPALLAAGLSPLAANVTNTVALTASGAGAAAGSLPELAGRWGRVGRLALLMVLGGVTGATLLLAMPAAAFEAVVPVLVGAASALLLAQPLVRRAVARRHAEPGGSRRAQTLGVLGAATYGGYFGAAAGVLLLATLQATTQDTLARSNAEKNVLLGVSNGVAAVGFAVFAPVHWAAAGAMAVGVLAGSRLGPVLVRHAPAGPLRVLIGLAGLALAVRLALDAW